MNTRHLMRSLVALIIAIVGLQQAVHAQTNFNSGSNGSFGPLIADSTTGPRTITLPADGILHCTTVKIDTSNYVQFVKNATNTPVYILATGDVNINGGIFVNGSTNVGRRGGEGGPGGFSGGNGGSAPANGFGPGGGKGGWVASNAPAGKTTRGGAGFGTAGLPVGNGGGVYGNSLLIPLTGGSGGGGGDSTDVSQQFGGGGGGGAVLIASNTKITFNHGNSPYLLQAIGGSASYNAGGGSGGSIRLVAPTISGNAYMQIYGVEGGGYGRIRVDALTNSLTINDYSGNNSQSYATFGANMVVFPTNLPELRVTKAAGTDIALTQTDPVFVLLPAGAPATQTVTVQAKNFNSVVPLVAVLTPEAGNRTTYNFDIDNTAGGATTGSVQVQVPAGVSTRIDVWTR